MLNTQSVYLRISVCAVYAQISLEASVARLSVMSRKQSSRSKSCRKTAAREFRPDDIVLSTSQITTPIAGADPEGTAGRARVGWEGFEA